MTNLPTLAQIYSGIISDLETKYNGTIPTTGKNFLRAMAGVQAGKLWLLYKTVGFTQKNIFVDTADSESMGGTLERFGRLKLGRNPFPAIAGIYDVEVTGSIGATIEASTTFKSDDSSANPGYLFVLDSQFTFAATTETIQLRALTAGLESELEIGNTLTATIPIALVDEIGAITTIDTPPQAAENIEDYRNKAMEAYRLEPQGGSGADYRLWSYETQGVKQAYPYALSGNTNEINLYIEATIADSTDGKGTPSTTILDGVQDSIELPTLTQPSRKPLTVYDIHYLPVTIREIDIEVNGFIGLTTAIETAIETAITEALTKVRPFVGSIDVLADKNDIFDINNIIALILQANPGSTFGTVVLNVDSTPVSTFTFLGGDIPHLNSITYP